MGNPYVLPHQSRAGVLWRTRADLQEPRSHADRVPTETLSSWAGCERALPVGGWTLTGDPSLLSCDVRPAAGSHSRAGGTGRACWLVGLVVVVVGGIFVIFVFASLWSSQGKMQPGNEACTWVVVCVCVCALVCVCVLACVCVCVVPRHDCLFARCV